jgi:hypothetical protein
MACAIRTSGKICSPAKTQKGTKFGKVSMEKLYVNEIRPNGEVSTVGLFYSRAEAEKIVSMLRDIPERAASRYEIVQAVRHLLAEKDERWAQTVSKE